jgi:predicted dehydrogenase
MNKITVGVIGAGYMGLNHIKTYSEMDNVDLVGYYDPFINANINSLRLESIVELASVCDCISICSPTPLHHQQALELLDYQCHLLIEKPVSPFIEEQVEIQQAASRNNLIVQVGFVEQYNPVTDFINTHLRNPDFISCIRIAPFSSRGSNVGVDQDLSVHDMGILLSCFDSDPKVNSFHSEPCLQFSEGADVVNGVIEFDNKKALFLTHRLGACRSRQITAHKSGATYCFDLITKEGSLLTKTGPQNLKLPAINPLRNQLETFIDCVANDSKPKFGIDFSIKVAQLIDSLNNKKK